METDHERGVYLKDTEEKPIALFRAEETHTPCRWDLDLLGLCKNTPLPIMYLAWKRDVYMKRKPTKSSDC